MAAPLTPLHGTLVCRGTPVGNHWRINKTEKCLFFSVTVCIRKSKAFCCVEYQVCENVPLAFSLDSKYSVANRGDTDTLCSNDYVAIPGKLVSKECVTDLD